MGDANRAVVERFRKSLETEDVAALGKLYEEIATPDIVQEWPQSGERIRGQEMIKRINEGYSAATGTSPKASFRRITGSGDVYVIEGTIDYGDGTPVSYVGIAELRDGKLTKITEYFANPFEAPAWRKEFVEMMERQPAAV